MKSFFILSVLLAAAQSFAGDIAVVTNLPNQASSVFKQMKQSTVLLTYIEESGYQDLADELVQGDYTEKKVYSQPLKQLVKYAPNLTCFKSYYMISGKNGDISNYAEKHYMTKEKQVNYGFLGTGLSIGASIYSGYSCNINL